MSHAQAAIWWLSVSFHQATARSAMLVPYTVSCAYKHETSCKLQWFCTYCATKAAGKKLSLELVPNESVDPGLEGSQEESAACSEKH